MHHIISITHPDGSKTFVSHYSNTRGLLPRTEVKYTVSVASAARFVTEAAALVAARDVQITLGNTYQVGVEDYLHIQNLMSTGRSAGELEAGIRALCKMADRFSKSVLTTEQILSYLDGSLDPFEPITGTTFSHKIVNSAYGMRQYNHNPYPTVQLVLRG